MANRFIPPNCKPDTGCGLDVQTTTCLPVSELCSTGMEPDTQYALVNNGGEVSVEAIDPNTDDQAAEEVSIEDEGGYYESDDVEGALQEIGQDCLDKQEQINANADAISALQAINPVVDTEVIAGSSDILVTYLDGTTETLDLPEFSASTDGNGLITFDLNGSPFGPFDTGAHTVDTDTDTFSAPVDNGDGTVTVAYADGSTHTYGTGAHTVDTVVTYDFAWAADGSVTITGSDGSVFTGPPNTVDTDTDTFATLSGQTITFANGDTLTIPSNESTMQRNADGSVTHTSDNGTTFDISTDGIKTTAAALAPTDYGLSRNVDKPVESATTLADVNDAKAATGDVSYSSMQQLFTNRAVEAGAGMMNTDGSLGHYNKRVADEDVAALLNENGGTMYVNPDNGTLAIPVPKYIGQVLHIKVNGTADLAVKQLTGRFKGVYRSIINADRRRRINQYASPFGLIEARSQETITLVGDAANFWHVQHDYWLYDLSGATGIVQEKTSGYAEIGSLAVFDDGPEQIVDVPLPVAIINPNANLKWAFGDYNAVDTPPVGTGLSTAVDAGSSFVAYRNSNTPTSVRLGHRNHAGATGVGPAAVSWHFEDGIIDYAALGGLA